MNRKEALLLIAIVILSVVSVGCSKDKKHNEPAEELWSSTRRSDCESYSTESNLEGKWKTRFTGTSIDIDVIFEFADGRLNATFDCGILEAHVSSRIYQGYNTITVLDSDSDSKSLDSENTCNGSISPATMNYEFYGRCLKLTDAKNPAAAPIYYKRTY